MKAIIEEGSPEVAAKMQELALAEGSLLRHLRTALVTPANDSRYLSRTRLIGLISFLFSFILFSIFETLT